MDAYWNEYERRVEKLEAEGLTRSDAQGVVDAEDMGPLGFRTRCESIAAEVNRVARGEQPRG
jgi:hypothetical protein